MLNSFAQKPCGVLILVLGLSPLTLGCGSSTSDTQNGTTPDAAMGETGTGGSSDGGAGSSGTSGSANDASGGKDSGDASSADVDSGDASSADVDSGSPDGSDGNADDDGATDGASQDGSTGNHKTSLAACWTEPTCHRALVMAHGGQWDTTSVPFLSRTAFEKAWQTGADGIEADIRVTADGVPMVAHSSPIEYYESIDCGGKKIEEMTADQVSKCHYAPSFTETFQRMSDVLDWANGKLIMEWDVKLTTDLPATVQMILQKGAADRATILVGTGEIQSAIPAIAGWEGLHYIADIGATAELQPTLGIVATHHIFLFEMDRSYVDATEAQVADLIKVPVNAAGMKAFGASEQYTATVQNHIDVYHQGFDVVLSYNVPNGVKAAQQVNVERGYSP
jgi:hypothetical protein